MGRMLASSGRADRSRWAAGVGVLRGNGGRCSSSGGGADASSSRRRDGRRAGRPAGGAFRSGCSSRASRRSGPSPRRGCHRSSGSYSSEPRFAHRRRPRPGASCRRCDAMSAWLVELEGAALRGNRLGGAADGRLRLESCFAGSLENPSPRPLAKEDTEVRCVPPSHHDGDPLSSSHSSGSESAGAQTGTWGLPTPGNGRRCEPAHP